MLKAMYIVPINNNDNNNNNNNNNIIVIIIKVMILIIIIIIILIIIIMIIIDISYSALSTYNVQKRFKKNSQWTDVYGPYSQINSFLISHQEKMDRHLVYDSTPGIEENERTASSYPRDDMIDYISSGRWVPL